MNCEKCGVEIPEGSQLCAACQVEESKPKPVEHRPQNTDDLLSLTKALLFFVVMAIPLVNIILLLRWSFRKGGNKSFTNLARASLIVLAVALLSYLLVVILA